MQLFILASGDEWMCGSLVLSISFFFIGLGLYRAAKERNVIIEQGMEKIVARLTEIASAMDKREQG